MEMELEMPYIVQEYCGEYGYLTIENTKDKPPVHRIFETLEEAEVFSKRFKHARIVDSENVKRVYRKP